MKIYLLLLSIFIFSCSNVKKPEIISANGCSDFLADIHKKGQNLKFIKCEESNVSQLRTLKAVYVVDGAKAKSIESQLVKELNMKPLKFLCCGWEGMPVDYIDEKENHYIVSMTSGETLEKN